MGSGSEVKPASPVSLLTITGTESREHQNQTDPSPMPYKHTWQEGASHTAETSYDFTPLVYFLDRRVSHITIVLVLRCHWVYQYSVDGGQVKVKRLGREYGGLSYASHNRN